MVRRAAEETAVEFGPGFKRLPAHDEILIAARKLPDPIGPRPVGLRMLERHQIGVFRPSRKVEQAADRLRGPAKRRVLADIGDQLAVDEHLSPIIQRLRML